jgi:hypothetical protein
MKLTRGTLKVIIGDLDNAIENDERARNGGKIFKPPYTVYEWNEEMKTLDVHRAFTVHAKNLKPRYAIGRLPFKWAPSALVDQRLWLETTDEIVLVTTHEEAISG